MKLLRHFLYISLLFGLAQLTVVFLFHGNVVAAGLSFLFGIIISILAAYILI